VIVTFPVVVIIGYFAELSRRGAAAALAAIMLFAIAALTLLIAESVPVWYRAAYFAVGPVGAIVGGALVRATYKRARE
jgi:bacteriorhodopsin